MIFEISNNNLTFFGISYLMEFFKKIWIFSGDIKCFVRIVKVLSLPWMTNAKYVEKFSRSKKVKTNLKILKRIPIKTKVRNFLMQFKRTDIWEEKPGNTTTGGILNSAYWDVIQYGECIAVLIDN